MTNVKVARHAQLYDAFRAVTRRMRAATYVRGTTSGATTTVSSGYRSYRSLVYPGMAPLEHNFRYHVFRALGNRASPSHAGIPEQCGRSRFPKAMRESPLLGHPPQKSQYRGAATPQALLGGIFVRYTPKRNGYTCSPPPRHCTRAV